MINLPFCRRRLFFDKIACALFSALLCAASASAEVLVSEGCDMASDYAGAAAISANGTNLLKTYPKTLNASTGIADGAKWTGWGDKPKAYAATLPLPESFAVVGLTSKGAACVGMARGSAATDHRWGYLRLAADKLKRSSGSTFYFRGLINIDTKAAAALTKTSDAINSGNSFGFGIATRPAAAESDANGKPRSAPNGLGFYYWRDKSGAYHLSALLVDAHATATTVPIWTNLAAPQEEGVLTNNTFICYAEVTVGACADGREVVRLGAVRVSDYNRAAVVWSDPVAVELVSDLSYPTDLYFTGDYCTGGCAMFDEFVVATTLSEILDVEMPAGVPVLSNAKLSVTSGGFMASASLSNGAAYDCGVLVFDGQTYTKLSAGPLAVDGQVEKAFSTGDIPSDKTCALYVYAENGVSAATNYVDVVYGGTPAIAKVSDADEEGRSPGSFTVSRADDLYDLTINYTVSGSAVPGVNYEALPGYAVIPAGATSATVQVVPLVASPHNADTVLALTLADGAYDRGEPPPAISISIANFAPPAGTNTWVAAADGLASDAANWSFGRVPVATDDILLDGAYSSAKLTWDGATSGMTDTVGSWTQTASYTGSVVMNQSRTDGGFTLFTVSGNASLLGGSWTHPDNGTEKTTQKTWLRLSVGGDLETGAGFAFDLNRSGYRKQRGPASGGPNTGAAYGGQGGSSVDEYGFGTCYGDYARPTSLGSGGYNSDSEIGGGVLNLTVSGDFVHNGVINASGDNAGIGGAAGGSVWIAAGSLSGAGSIAADGGGSNASNNKGGAGGGRVAIHLTDPSASLKSLWTAFTGTVAAYGGDGLNNSFHYPGAAGTVYVEVPSDAGKGHMIVAHSSAKLAAATKGWTINGTAQIGNGITWNIADLAIKEHGRVGIVTGGTLHVPSFSKIAGDGSTQTLLRFDGGSVTSDIRHDRLVADGFAVESAGTNSFAAHTLVIPDDSSLKVSGKFTVGALIMGHTRLDAGDYSAAALAETYGNISGGGTIHVLGLADALKIIVR